MRFRDRRDAGRRLGAALARRADLAGEPSGRGRPVVVGIARGGVIVAAEVAAVLGADLAIVVARKVGAPDAPELAMGAIAPGVTVLDRATVDLVGATADEVERVIASEHRELERRERRYLAGREAVALSGRTVVLVDDGLATGATAVASVRWARAQGAARVVLAVPVASPEAAARLRHEADEVVALEVPDGFGAVGAWYGSFGPVGDDEVVAALVGSAT